MKTPRTIIGATAAGILALGLLTACTTDEPTPEPTTDPPTPTATSTPTPEPTEAVTEAPAPTTAEEAVDTGYEVAKEFFRVWDEIQAEHPNDTSALEDIAKGPALETAVGVTKQDADEGITTTGASEFTMLSEESYAAPAVGQDGKIETEFGQPIVIGCHDRSGIELTDASGKPIEVAAPLKTEVIVRYFADESQWYVVNIENEGLEGSECEK